MVTTRQLRACRPAEPVARSPWIADTAIVALIVGLGLLPPPARELGWAGVALNLALALPLLWRRRAPVVVFALIATVALGQWIAGVIAFGDSALLVALYTVAASRPLREALTAAAVVEFGVVLAATTWGHGDMLQAWVGLTGLAVAAGVLGMNVRGRRALVVSLHERASRLEAERDQEGRLAAAAERARIAREMHDIVAHNLSVMIALADGASFAVRDAPDRAEDAMQIASRTGRQALTEMRRLLGVLRDEAAGGDRAPQPGLAQIEDLVEQVRAAGLPVDLEVAGEAPASMPSGLQLAAYRIVQEALTNTLKHAGPGARATVALRHRDDGLQLEVRDTGLAFGGAPAADGGGLRGMRERAAVYDGAVEAGPLATGGWRVYAVLAPAGAETRAALGSATAGVPA